MKTRLDPKYRRTLQAKSHPRSDRFWKNPGLSEHDTVLPFTTKTRAYGTYVDKT
jgi:hypothetical protein